MGPSGVSNKTWHGEELLLMKSRPRLALPTLSTKYQRDNKPMDNLDHDSSIQSVETIALEASGSRSASAMALNMHAVSGLECWLNTPVCYRLVCEHLGPSHNIDPVMDVTGCKRYVIFSEHL